jgi:thiol-disulfide isomerase/thioredoxin
MRAFVTYTVAAVILLACFSQGHGAEQSGQAEEILRKAAKAYEALKSYRGETILVVNMADGETEERIESRYSLAVERPNKLALVLESGDTGITLVSDGKKLYTYVPMLKQYTVEKAPGSLDKLLKGGTKEPRAVMMAAGSVRVLPFFGSGGYKTIMSDVEEAEFVGEEVLEKTKTYHVVVRQTESDIDLWVDARTFLLKQIRVDMAKAIEKQAKLTPEAAQMKMIFEEVHRKVKAGDAIPPDTFVFHPPEGAQQTDSLTGRPESPLVGKKAPDFTLDGLKEGTSFRLADYKGKVVMLDFWASWCAPCRYEMPVLQEVYDRYKEKGVVLIAVNAREGRDIAERFVAGGGYTFPVALDLDGSVESVYARRGLPTLVIIDRQGIIRKVHVGFAQGLKKRLEEELDVLLAGKPPAGN